MNDEAIKKALECCLLGECKSCPIIRFQDCRIMLKDETISLLNRQQAEIERLKTDLKTTENVIKNSFLKKAGFDIDLLAEFKSEAIKEFAERFIDEECAYCSSESDEMIFFKKRFDNLLAEMVGGENDTN